MQILVIKTSSMGDVIHTLPALTDARHALTDVQFDWVVEERFAAIAAWHPAVRKVIPVALRRWRKRPLQFWWSKEFRHFRQDLRECQYDYVIDAQGLIKSAIWTRLAGGLRCGFDRTSAREPIATLAYQKKIKVAREQHAIMKLRQLFAKALNYQIPFEIPNYGLIRQQFCVDEQKKYVVLVHGTTWATKHWPERYWHELVQKLVELDYAVKICWGNQKEYARSQRLQQNITNVEVLPQLHIEGVAQVLAGAHAVVAVDTGFMHLADALSVPLIALFGPTDARFHGPLAQINKVLIANEPSCAPCHKRTCHYQGTCEFSPACLATITPTAVLHKIQEMA